MQKQELEDFMKVEAITDLKHIKSIKKLLVNQPRNRLLFIMGINAGLRVQDILNLKLGDVREVKVGDRISIIEKKTGKENVLMINKDIKDALDAYLKTIGVDDQHYLFKNRKGSNYPLTTYAVTKYVKEWCEAINLHINAGAHTLRKTWCFHQRKTYGTSWELIAKRLNTVVRPSPDATLAFKRRRSKKS